MSCLRQVTTVMAFGILVIFATNDLQAQQTLGGITGTVLDPSGSAVPGVEVKAVSDDTKLERTAKSNVEGTYSLVDLPIGTYTITFTREGFSVEKVPGILVQADRTVTLPGHLALGAVADSVIVDVNPLLNAVDPTNGYVLDRAQIEAVPLPTGSFTGLAILTPGVNAELAGGTGANSGLGNAPIWANGQRDTSNSFLLNGVDASNLFNGKSTSQSGSARVVNGTGVGNASAGGIEQSSASIYLSVGNALPSPAPETIQEVRVNASMYDAQQGSTSGAHIDISTASGTNEYHGSGYIHRGTDWLNAAPFFFKNDSNIPANEKVPQLHRYTAGFTAGGPIIKDKVFFFAGYQHIHVSDQEIGISRLDVPAGLDNTAATRSNDGLAALANANFGSGDLTGAQISPVASFLFNYKLPNGQYLIPGATGTPSYAHPDNASIPGTAYFTADQAVADLDYNASTKDTLAAKYYYQHDPTIAPYGYSNVPGFAVHVDSGSHVFSISNTYILKSNLTTIQTLGFDRMKAYAYNDQLFTAQDAGINAFGSSYFPGVSIIDVLGNATPDGLGAQSLNIGPNAFSPGSNTGMFQNRVMPSGNALWLLGRHSLSMGGNYSYTQLNIRDRRTGTGQISTQDFGNFAQGNIAAQNASFTTTTFLVGNANRYYRANQVGAYVQDKLQLFPNLSLTAGVRYDWDAGLTEKNGNIFNFNPSTYSFNPACLTNGDDSPADCYPGNGIVIAGNNKQATPGASKTTLTGRQWGFGPRIGAAWQPKMFNDKVVVRAGTGIYYDRGENFAFFSPGYSIGQVTGGPFGVAQSPPFVNAVQCNPNGGSDPVDTPGATCAGTYSLSTPYGSGTSFKQPTGKAADLTNYLQTPDQITNGGQMTTITTYAQGNKLPYTINYMLDIQWQPRNNLVVQVGYVGNLARHQVVPVPLNQAQIATPGHPINGQYYSYGYSVQTAGNDYCYYDCSPAHLPDLPGQASSVYLANYEGGNVDLRVPYLGYASESLTYKAAGIGQYNALQAHVEQRLTHGLVVGGSYTYSHALDEQSNLGLFYTGGNALDLRSGYASADFDRTHVLNVNFNYQFPSPFSESTLAGKFTGGWSISGIVIAQSGQPYSVVDFSGASGSIYFSTYNGITNAVVPLAAGCTPKSARTGQSGAFGSPALKSSCFTVPLLSGAAATANGVPGPSFDAPLGDIYETTFPQGQRNIFRQSAQKRADISLIKEIRAMDRYALRYTFDVFNLTNTASFDVPNAQTTQNSSYNPTPAAEQTLDDFYSPPNNVGYVQHTIGSARQIQMSLKLSF